MIDLTRHRDGSVDWHRVSWWLFLGLLVAASASVVAKFPGELVLGVFGYYATRPIRRRIDAVVDSDRLSATLTISAVLLPVVALLAYLAVRIAQRVDGSGGSAFGLETLSDAQSQELLWLFRNPASALSAQGGTLGSNADLLVAAANAVLAALLTVGIAVTLAALLLVRDDTVSSVFVELAGGRDSGAYAYAAAVDEDLESVFFGNLLFAALMAVVAMVTYGATNLVAPAGVAVPMVFVLGLLTGAASLVPIVVGKLVYVPVVAYLAVQAGGSSMGFVLAVGVVYLLVLDLLPQAVVQPYVTGRRFDMATLLFAYVMGPLAFGWYGFFLLPILFVLVFEAVDIVLPDLLRGRSPTAATSLSATSTGTDPEEERDDVPEDA